METSHTQLVSHTGEYQSVCPFSKDQRKVSKCGQEEEGKRASWIAIAQQLVFIYIQGVLLTKLLWSYPSNIVGLNADAAWLLIMLSIMLTDVLSVALTRHLHIVYNNRTG